MGVDEAAMRRILTGTWPGLRSPKRPDAGGRLAALLWRCYPRWRRRRPSRTCRRSAPDSWVPRDTADLLVLDKVNAKSTAVTLKVGQAADNASLSIALRACVVRPPDLPKDSAAYLDITDSRPGAPGFHGWMLANEPAVSMLEHPIYDVRLVACH